MLSMIIIITCTVSCQYHYCHPLHNYLHDHPHGWHIQFWVWHNSSTKPQNHLWYKKIYKIIVNQDKSCQSCHDPRLTRPLVSSLLSSMPKLIENHFHQSYTKMPFIIANAMLCWLNVITGEFLKSSDQLWNWKQDTFSAPLLLCPS